MHPDTSGCFEFLTGHRVNREIDRFGRGPADLDEPGDVASSAETVIRKRQFFRLLCAAEELPSTTAQGRLLNPGCFLDDRQQSLNRILVIVLLLPTNVSLRLWLHTHQCCIITNYASLHYHRFKYLSGHRRWDRYGASLCFTSAPERTSRPAHILINFNNNDYFVHDAQTSA